MAQRNFDPERISRVAAALDPGNTPPARSLCQRAASVLEVSGAGVVMWSANRPIGNVCASDPVTESVEDSQYALGEGPCVEAFRARTPIRMPDLDDPAETRWSEFRLDALAAGIRAAFGFPLLVGSVCLGVLDLYQERSGELSTEQYADALVVAHVVGRTVLRWQTAAGPGTVAWQLEQVPIHRAVVNQATGRISVQAAVTVDDALELLRAYAFAEARSVGDVAEDVVAGGLRFDPA
jgi:hypothetical protein